MLVAQVRTDIGQTLTSADFRVGGEPQPGGGADLLGELLGADPVGSFARAGLLARNVVAPCEPDQDAVSRSR